MDAFDLSKHVVNTMMSGQSTASRFILALEANDTTAINDFVVACKHEIDLIKHQCAVRMPSISQITVFCTASKRLALVAEKIGKDLAEAQSILVGALEFIGRRKTVGIFLEVMMLRFYLMNIYAKTGEAKKSKALLSKSDKQYEELRLQPNQDVRKLNHIFLLLLKCHDRFAYITQNAFEKMHFGSLELKYSLAYDFYAPFLWIHECLNTARCALMCKAYGQSCYLLKAAKLMLENFNKTTRALGELDSIRFYAGRIHLQFAVHILSILEASMVLREAEEKLAAGQQVTPEEEEHFKTCNNLITFDNFLTYDPVDKLTGLIQDLTLMAKAFKFMFDSFHEAMRLLTIHQMLQFLLGNYYIDASDLHKMFKQKFGKE